MSLSFLTLFKAKKESIETPHNSPILEKIQSLSNNSNLKIFSYKEIFHHKESYPIPLIIYDNLRGLYIFEIKRWSYNDLKNAEAKKAKGVEKSNDTLAFDKTHDIIKQKFNELLHNDGVAIFNYLIMENLSSQEYENLNDSLRELLPKEKIIFNDSDNSDIFKKLQNAAEEDHTLPTVQKVFGTLFIQYAIVEKNSEIVLCNSKQIEFIDTKTSSLFNLSGAAKSGKSSILLLKSIKELFKQERKKIILIKPTILSKDIAHKYFLEIIEHAIIDIDLMAFEILTPAELINRHLSKLKMPSLLDDIFYIDEKLMKKSFEAAELIICDDVNLMPEGFTTYLKHIQKDSDLLLVNDNSCKANMNLEKSYLSDVKTLYFHQTHPHAKALHTITSLLKQTTADNIIVVANRESLEKLQEDLLSFIEDDTLLLDANKHLVDQKLDSLVLASYDDIIDLTAEHLIVMDLCCATQDQLQYTLNIAEQTLHILYEEECDKITMLKEKYENNEE